MTSMSHLKTSRSIRRSILGGLVVSAILVFGVGGWAATTQLSGAVIAAGSLVVDSDVKKVQHPTGGVVGELRVKDGDAVRAGDILLRLDETVTRSNLAMITKSMDDLTVRQARLKAEQDGRPSVTFGDDITSRIANADVAALLGEERGLFEMRRTARDGQKAQLTKRVDQLNEQVQGMRDQIVAKDRELQLIGQELVGLRELFQKKLVPMSRVTALERDSARLDGDRGGLVSSIAQSRGKIIETELQILQIDQDLRTEVGKELADIRSKLAELGEKRVAAVDQLERVDIRAPQSGFVHQLNVHTIGGVINAGEQIMLIVPQGDLLTVEARLAPESIDQVRVGHQALLRLSAFNQRTTPEIMGEVSRVAADLSTDQKTGARYYTVRIAIPQSELARLNGFKLVPGMPVESFIQTGDRTVASYLMKPLADQLMRAWRER